MIRKSLSQTQDATFSVLLPNHNNLGMPTPTGTGFFVSGDGWFVTAAHVVTENNQADGPVRSDISNSALKKEERVAGAPPGAMCSHVTFAHILPKYDFALLRVDFSANSNKEWLKGRSSFPHITISTRTLEEGEPVYSFGYPLSSAFAKSIGPLSIGTMTLCPRVTSAIVASTFEETRMVMTSADPQIYVLDKALNYGNSGGPIVATETGKVHALCSRFQPVFVPQAHLHDAKGNAMLIMVPSLYGVVSSIGNSEIVNLLSNLGISVAAD